MIESRIVNQIADVTCKNICKEVIKMKKKEPSTLMGDSNSLKNAWEDICLQVQSEQSIIWESYLESLDTCIANSITKLLPVYQQAIWLQSSNGVDWLFDNEDSKNSPPVDLSDLLDYIRDNYVLQEADNYSSESIEKCKEREMD